MKADYYGMRNFLITFYIGEYPDIDPNIGHEYNELQKGGLVLAPKGRNYLEDEIKYHFGASIPVITQDYDYDKLQKDYGFSKLPKIEFSAKDYISFTDGIDSFTLSKHESVHYLKKTVRDMFVYRKKEIRKVMTKSYEMYSFLCSLFKKERGFEPLLGNTYVLSENMINQLERYDSKLTLSSHYDAECPNIFFTLSDVHREVYP